MGNINDTNNRLATDTPDTTTTTTTGGVSVTFSSPSNGPCNLTFTPDCGGVTTNNNMYMAATDTPDTPTVTIPGINFPYTFYPSEHGVDDIFGTYTFNCGGCEYIRNIERVCNDNDISYTVLGSSVTTTTTEDVTTTSTTEDVTTTSTTEDVTTTSTTEDVTTTSTTEDVTTTSTTEDVTTTTTTEDVTTTTTQRQYSTFFKSTVKSEYGCDQIVDENGDPGGFCHPSSGYLVETRFYVEGANRNIHSNLQDQNVYTDSNLTNPLPDGYYYCSANSEEAGGVTYTALPGLTHKGIQVENGVADCSTHNCSDECGGGNNEL